jgi:hypothetical protein
MIAAIGTAVTFLVACSGTSKTATSSAGDHTSASVSAESPTPSSTTNQSVEHKTGEPVSVQAAYEGYAGSYMLTVGAPLGSAVTGGSLIEVGIPIKINKVTGSPLVSATFFVLGPVSDPAYPSGWNPSSDPTTGETAADRTACRNVPLLSTALYKAGVGEDNYQFELKPGVKAAACVTFFYARTDKPTTVGLNPDGGDPIHPALTWHVPMPG